MIYSICVELWPRSLSSSRSRSRSGSRSRRRRRRSSSSLELDSNRYNQRGSQPQSSTHIASPPVSFQWVWLKPTEIIQSTNHSNRASAGINSSFETTLPSPPKFPITRKKPFKIPMKIALEYVESKNARIGLEVTPELKRNNKLQAFDILETDPNYREKSMMDACKEKKYQFF